MKENVGFDCRACRFFGWNRYAKVFVYFFFGTDCTNDLRLLHLEERE